MHHLLPAPASSAVVHAVHAFTPKPLYPSAKVLLTPALLLSAHLPVLLLQIHAIANFGKPATNTNGETARVF